MRELTDCLRSVKKYLAEVLEPQPPLAEAFWGSQRWSLHRHVKDARPVNGFVFRWLLQQDRHAPVVSGDVDDVLTYYRRTELVSDPRPAAALLGLDLSQPVNSTWDLGLGKLWEVRLSSSDPGTILLPLAIVRAVGPVNPSGPALYHEFTQPMAIECYPDIAESPDAAVLTAARVQQRLVDGFKGPGVGAGRSKRIPLWDYDGVGLAEVATERASTDFMRVVDFSSRPMQDPDDLLRIRVVADLRVSWRRDIPLTEIRDRSGRGVRGTRVVHSVTIEHDVN